MDNNLEICLEELDAGPEDECFVRCVAIEGGQPGLALDPDGLVRWMPDDADACHGLWVSADGRLMLHGVVTDTPVVVERGARTQEAPAGQPIVLLDQDLLRIGDRRLLVHFHGETEELYEPERLTRSAMMKFFQAAAAAATLTLGGAGLAAGPAAGPQSVVGEPPPIEVRRRPPAPVRRITLDCKVTGQKAKKGKKGKVHVTATCPNTFGLRVKAYGRLIDKKGRSIAKGTVYITSIKGKTIQAEAPYLKKPVKATLIRFWVRR